MSVEEQLRAYGRTIEQRRVPIVAQEVLNEEAVMFDPTGDVEPRPPRSRWILSAAAVTVLVAAVGLLTVGGGDSEPSDTPIDSPPTNPTIPPTTVPVTTPATTTATETAPSTTAPSTTVQSETDAAGAGSEQPPALQRPVSGQTQRSVVGDITWTLFEGDASNVPEGPFIGVDGWYLGAVDDGRTWRSSDGIEWELVDLGGDGVADEEVFGEFVFAGETWARTNAGLARWDGDTFVPVALPEPGVVDLDGLRVSGPWVEAPVVLGDELVVPFGTWLSVPWDELFADGARVEWAGDPQSIRIVDTSRIEDYFPDGPLPVLAVLSAEFVDGEPGRFEFRDVESNELVTTVEAIPGVDPAEFLPRILDGRYCEILIGDADGFEAVEPPGGCVLAGPTGPVVPIDGGVLGITQQGYPTLTVEGALGAEAWELWTSSDARSWTRLDLPTPSGSIIDIVNLASDGSTAILTIYSRRTAESTQDVESWTTVDGRRWQKIDVTALSSVMWPAEFGWLATLDDQDIALSPDGRTWQEVRFGFTPELSGGGASVVSRSIFVHTNRPDSPARSLWIGQVADQ